MSNHIVYEGVPRSRNDDNNDGSSLFGGQKLWFAHTVPQRKWLIENARLNGAVVVDMDTEADVKLVDHAKKNHTPGTHSYKYVESSIRSGRLEDLARHAIGVSARVSRTVGSTVTAPKSGRTPFTSEDDQILWNWVKPVMDRGGAWRGNEIFKQLEEANPRHTFQSWRDRWDKYTKFQNRQITDTLESQDHRPKRPAAEPSKPVPQRKRHRDLDDDGEAQRPGRDVQGRDARLEQPRRSPVRRTPRARTYTDGEAGHDALRGMRTKASPAKISPAMHQNRGHGNGKKPVQADTESSGPNLARGNAVEGNLSNTLSPEPSRPFTKQEYDELWDLVATIEGKAWDDYDKPWEELAEDKNSHTADEWKQYFFSKVLPEYCKEKQLPISHVAPFLLQNAEGNDVNEHDEDGAEEETGQLSEASSTQEELSCAICFATDNGKWRQDKEGRVLCYYCHKLVKQHGYHRASILQCERRCQGEVEATGAVRRRGEEQTSPVAGNDPAEKITPTPPSKSTDRRKQSATAASPSHDIAGPSRAAHQASPAEPRRRRSPSFQPQSPTSSRPPESNISRKRGAGKSLQSQSTQPSNSSNPNSQNAISSIQSRSQESAPQRLGVDMGQSQSTLDNPQPAQPLFSSIRKVANSAPSFQAPSKGKRKRLQDEPDTLPTLQDSSLSTDAAPPPQRSTRLSSSVSDKDNDHASGPITFPTLITPSGCFQTQARFSPLLDPEDEETDIEEDIGTRPHHAASDDLASSPALVELVSEGHEVNADIQLNSEPKFEEADGDEDEDANFGDLVPPNKRHRSEAFEAIQETPEIFETAQEEQDQETNNGPVQAQTLFEGLDDDDDFDMTELPDPPGGFEAYGVGASVVPLDHENNPGQESSLLSGEDAFEEEPVADDERDQSPEIKLEYASGLESHDESMVLLEDTPRVILPGADRPEVHLADQKEARNREQEQENEKQEQARKREVQGARGHEEQAAARINAKRREEAQRRLGDQEPSSPTAVDDTAPRVRTSPKPESTPFPPPLNIHEWLAQQHKLHPRIRALEPILFRAAEATGFNFALATDVVNQMLSKRDAHMSHLRNRHSCERATTTDLLDLDVDLCLPGDMRGVWTKEDDNDLVYQGAKGQNRVAGKHGRDGCAARFEYLGSQADDE